MKRMIISLLVVLSMLAVSCETMEQIIPIFPEKQELVFSEAGQVQELSFTANSDWTLVSSAVWCQFVDEKGETRNSIQGEEGECKVKIKVTEKGQQVGDENTKDITSILMIMKDQKQAIASIVRNAKKFDFHLLDAEGNPVALENSVIEVGYEEYIPFTVQANFPFVVKSQPKWVEFKDGSVTGSIGQKVVAKARMINDGQMEKYPIELSEENVIVFSDREGKAEFKIKVKYAGMPAGVIEIESAGPRTDWTVSMDGLTYIQEGTTQGEEGGEIQFENEIPATVKTLNDEFDLMFLEEYENYGMKMIGSNLDGDPTHPVDWMNVQNEKGKLTISVGETSTDRHGWILALPKGCDITAENWFEKLISNVMDPESGMPVQSLDLDAVEPYLVAELVQAEPKEEGSAAAMIVKDMMQNELPLEKLTGEWVSSEYGVSEAYVLKQTSAPLSVFIDPMLEGEYECSVWMGDTDKSDILDFSSGLPRIWLEEMLVPGQTLAVIFKQNWVNVKVLLIEVAE